MIYINGTLVNFSNRKPDYEFAHEVEDYHKTIQDLKERHDGVIRFIAKTHDPLKPRMKPPKGYSWWAKTKVVDHNNNQQTWVYTETAAEIINGIATPIPKLINLSRGEETWRIDTDPELIYFLTKHSAVRKGKIYIYDPEKNERERAELRRMESKFKDLIYSDNSPLYEDTEKLKLIARKWGIGNVESMSDDAIRNTLYDTVLLEEEKKKKGRSDSGLKDFLTDFELGDSVKIGAAVQQGLDKGILTFDRTSGEWQLVVSKDQMPLSLMRVDPSATDRARQKLVEYLGRNKHDFETLNRVVKGEAVLKYGQVHEKGTVDPVSTEVNLDNISKASFRDLQKAGKELGINTFSKKTEELRSMIKEKLQELQPS